MRQRNQIVHPILLVTLVLVVVAALLSPIFIDRAERPKPTCQSNLKRCAIALQTYCYDYDDHLPSSAIVRGSKSWNRRDFLHFATRRGEIPPRPGERPRTWSQALSKCSRDPDMFYCYQDPVSRQDARAQVSYWWKLAVDKAWYGEGCARPCRRLADFGYDADQVIFYEHRAFHFPEKTGLFSKQPMALKNGVRINVAYMDTHVRSIELSNTTSGRPDNCAANSDGEPMYYNFDNTRPRSGVNPPPDNRPARYIDPARYSDMLR